MSVHPAATPGSESPGNQKALLKAGQEMNQSWQQWMESGVAHTPVCFLFWPGGFVKTQPVETARLSSPDSLKHFVLNFESLVENEAQLTAGTARPAVNPNPLQRRRETDGYFSPCKG